MKFLSSKYIQIVFKIPVPTLQKAHSSLHNKNIAVNNA
jgi:hypothetical protein